MSLAEALAKIPAEDSLEDILKRSPGDTSHPRAAQFYAAPGTAAAAPTLAGPTPSTYFAVPTGGSLDALCLPSVVMPSRHPVRMVPTRGTAGSFNHVWCNALNSREALKLTHFAMHHADVGAVPFWMDFFFAAMDRTGADIISAVIPIKDDRGLTSTAVRNGKTRYIRRLTIAEVNDLPETFTLADIPWADPAEDALLLNNGLWVCRFTEPWVEEVCFHFIEWNVRRPDGQFVACFFSEDWQFSEFLTTKGLKLYATRKVPIQHAGRRDFVCDGSTWGDWKTDQGDQARI